MPCSCFYIWAVAGQLRRALFLATQLRRHQPEIPETASASNGCPQLLPCVQGMHGVVSSRSVAQEQLYESSSAFQISDDARGMGLVLLPTGDVLFRPEEPHVLSGEDYVPQPSRSRHAEMDDGAIRLSGEYLPVFHRY